jgi:hypothetical protein
MIIQFTGLKNVDKYGVLLFPKILVCLDCGFFGHAVPTPKLVLLSKVFRRANALPVTLSPSKQTARSLFQEVFRRTQRTAKFQRKRAQHGASIGRVSFKD